MSSTQPPESLTSLEHFLSVRDLSPGVLTDLIAFAVTRKQQFLAGDLPRVLQGKVLAMIFQKSSLRTRVAFEAAMTQLGGHAINLDDTQIGLGKREDVSDIAKVISSMCDGIVARVFGHTLVVQLAADSRVPVINGLSDWAHPCQALADLMTIQEHFGGEFTERKLAYIGDANNVARSLFNACLKVGMAFSIASPKGYELDNGLVQAADSLGAKSKARVQLTNDPRDAVRDADVVYTDVWTSMGQETEQADRAKVFAGYQINADLLKAAKTTAIVLHCLPAHRGEEITAEVLNGPQSKVFQQAENRLHSQRALLEVLLAK